MTTGVHCATLEDLARDSPNVPEQLRLLDVWLDACYMPQDLGLSLCLREPNVQMDGKVKDIVLRQYS